MSIWNSGSACGGSPNTRKHVFSSWSMKLRWRMSPSSTLNFRTDMLFSYWPGFLTGSRTPASNEEKWDRRVQVSCLWSFDSETGSHFWSQLVTIVSWTKANKGYFVLAVLCELIGPVIQHSHFSTSVSELNKAVEQALNHDRAAVCGK